MRDLKGWQPIETAPTDGTWVLLCGGKPNPTSDPPNWYLEEWGTSRNPAVVGFSFTMPDGKVYWNYAFWDGDWYSDYENPTHWKPLELPDA